MPATPSYTLRALDPSRDLPSVARLLSLLWPVTVTPERLAESEAEAAPRLQGDGQGYLRVRTVAEDDAGQVVGMADGSRAAWTAPGQAAIAVVVEPAHRARGVGSRLLAAVVAYLRDQGAMTGRGYVRDDRPHALRFARQHRFEVVRHEFGSSLDLTTFDEAPLVGALERARAAGFRFFSLADLGNTEDDLRQLYALNARTVADVPGTEDAFPPFERFRAELLAPRGRSERPDGLIVAAYGERWVGIALVSYSPDDRVAYNSHTGVLPEFRGRGVAHALKLLALRAARSWGAVRIRTDNDDTNAPMLHVNRAFGYRPEPGWLLVKGPLSH